MAESRCIWDARVELGEGALWLADEEAIYWVDILGHKVMRLKPATGVQTEWQAPGQIGAVLPRKTSGPGKSGGFVALLQDGFAFFDPESGDFTPLSDPEPDKPGNRLNDGCVDSRGRIWAGTMRLDAAGGAGSLYRLDADLSCHKVDAGYDCTNGPAFSPDGRVMYHNDTMRRTVYAFDVDVESGAISGKRIFLELRDIYGLPDGLTVDREGHLWLAHLGAGKVCRYDAGGRHVQTIPIPAPLVTSCCFGGADLSTLFVTTARMLLNDADRAAYPQSGGLFAIETDTVGQMPCSFAG